MGAPISDGLMALVGVVAPVSSVPADLHISPDPVEQFRQRGRIPDVATGDLDGATFQRLFIDADMDLAPQTASPPLPCSRVRQVWIEASR